MSSIHFSGASKACPAQISCAWKAAGGQGEPGWVPGCAEPHATGGNGGVPAAPGPSPPTPPGAPKPFARRVDGWRGARPRHPARTPLRHKVLLLP